MWRFKIGAKLNIIQLSSKIDYQVYCFILPEKTDEGPHTNSIYSLLIGNYNLEGNPFDC